MASEWISNFFTPQVIVGIASPIVGALVVIVTMYYQRKNLEINSLDRVFKLLSNETNRTLRKWAYDKWEEYTQGYLDPNYLSLDERNKKKAEELGTIFEEIGVLIYKKIDLKTKKQSILDHGYLPKDVFLTSFSGAVINSWICLESFVDYQRNDRDAPYFWRYFDKLYDDAKIFRDNNHLPKTKYQKLQTEFENNGK